MKTIALFLVLLSPLVLKTENPRSPFPPKGDFTPLPSGISFLSITNNNSQAMAVSEHRKETTICPPPVILTPSPFPHDPEKTKSKNYGLDFLRQLRTKPFNLTTLCLALGASALCYAIIYARLSYLSKKVIMTDDWGSFQGQIKPSVLSQLPAHAIAQKLIEEIKKKYKPVNPNNLIESFLAFNTDIEQELQNLHKFINFYSLLINLKLSYILPDYQRILEIAEEKVKRLIILKEALISWTNENSVKLLYDDLISPKSNEWSEENNDEISCIHEIQDLGY